MFDGDYDLPELREKIVRYEDTEKRDFGDCAFYWDKQSRRRLRKLPFLYLGMSLIVGILPVYGSRIMQEIREGLKRGVEKKVEEVKKDESFKLSVVLEDQIHK